MPILTGTVEQITGQPIPADLSPRLFFKAPREIRSAAGSLVSTREMEAPLNGGAFSIDLLPTEGAKFDSGQPAFYVAILKWYDQAGQLVRVDEWQPVVVSTAGGELGEQGRVIVPAGAMILIQLETPTEHGPYYWLKSTTGDPDIEATGPGDLYLVKGAK